MRKILYVWLLVGLCPFWAFCQGGFVLVIVNEHREPVGGATVKMLEGGGPGRTVVAGDDGKVRLEGVKKGGYRFLVTGAGYQAVTTNEYRMPRVGRDTIVLRLAGALQDVTVTAKPVAVEHRKDKTIVNVDASVTNTGSTVLEVLERSPGVIVDRNGGISLNGKPGVLVMIDDRPTYLTGDDLNNLLSSMSSSQVATIELMPNPMAKYDAAGTGGIINIRTKKSRQAGWNGSLTTSYGQGKYPKNNNSLVLNYREGPVNAFLTYSFAANRYLTDLYAYRQYDDDAGHVTAILRQPSYFSGTVLNHTVKAGVDYRVSSGTTVGMVLSGVNIHRRGNNTSHADWLGQDGAVDSSILTTSHPRTFFTNEGINVNGKQRLSSNAQLSMDLDYLHYSMQTNQDFDNRLLAAGGYDDLYRSSIPTTIHIATGKVDGDFGLGGSLRLLAGVKISSNHTDNAALYENWDSQSWVKDSTRSDHFLYRENIGAVYGSIEGKAGKWQYQAGLRYEYTDYVTRSYGGLFPSGMLSYQADSMNGISLTLTRRLDRPAFQSLNPFLYIINKYTYETGNAYLLPQYSWNIELSHQYGGLLTTGVSYSRLTNYFSQIFLSDTSKTILYYTQGNVGSVDNLGLSASLSLSPLSWWSMALTAVYNYKYFKGFNGNAYVSSIHQMNLNVNNQLDFGKGYTGELSGFYTTRARNDIQERLYPTGQVSMGVSKTVLQKKGTLKLSYRDIFYTSAMEGLTSFPDATEYFKIKRDSRVVVLAFTYRFGGNFKRGRHEEGASEEKERAPNG